MNYNGELGINRIMQPGMSIASFLRLASRCGFSSIELRNDLPDDRVLGDESAADIMTVSRETGVRILTVNAMQRFNDPQLFDRKIIELGQLIYEAKQVNCSRIIFCPVNDPKDRRGAAEQQDDLVAALQCYAPTLRQHSVTALLEPLGFPICSMRFKRQAADAIRESGLHRVYGIVHDTFHHYLSGETELFPEETGLIHTSGVRPGKEMSEITDDDRIFVDADDCMGNREQIAAMIAQGYGGPISYEPFSREVQEMSEREVESRLRASLAYLFG